LHNKNNNFRQVYAKSKKSRWMGKS
jgi:hypothetical protein